LVISAIRWIKEAQRNYARQPDHIRALGGVLVGVAIVVLIVILTAML
jgi:hypothetical protein